jgi:hypothetical protein
MIEKRIKMGHKRTQSNSEYDFEALKNQTEPNNSAKHSQQVKFHKDKDKKNLTERLLEISEKKQIRVISLFRIIVNISSLKILTLDVNKKKKMVSSSLEKNKTAR